MFKSVFCAKILFPLTLALSLAVLASSGAHATGLMSCASDQSQWQSMDALQAHLENEGWTRIRKIKVDEGCYEAYATTPEGDRVEAYFDPVTLEKLLVSRRGEILFRKDDNSSNAP